MSSFHSDSRGNDCEPRHADFPIRSLTKCEMPKHTGLPPFSAIPLLLVVVAKPLTDAFYDIESVKYGYMIILMFASLFARIGRTLQGQKSSPQDNNFFAYFLLIGFYFTFHLYLLISYGGTLSEIFKIISPFVFFFLVAFAADRWLIGALTVGAVLTIVLNTAALPFDFGWVMWGAVKTFKGYYYFKTDLAYALCFSTLLYAFYTRYSITPFLIALMISAAVQIVLANSRLNYLSFFVVVIFIASKQGANISAISRYVLLVGLLALVAVVAYDPTRALGFDTSSQAVFTQGRSVTWQRLFYAFLNYSPIEWMFGRGAFADLILSAMVVAPGQEAHNAHNEVLHLIFTQGLLGAAMYFFLWHLTFRLSQTSTPPAWARGTSAIALLLFAFQSMTAVLSSYATKTWPLIMILLAVRGLGSSTNHQKGDVC